MTTLENSKMIIKTIAIFLIVFCVPIVLVSIFYFLQDTPYKNFINKGRFFIVNTKKETGKKSVINKNKPIYVINLDKDTDRLELFQNNWREIFGLENIIRYPGYKLQNQRTPHLGCTHAHIRCILSYFKNHPDQKTAIVFEDDAVPFDELEREDVLEYLAILEKHADYFDVANMSPISWQTRFDYDEKKSELFSQAPDHFSLLVNGNGVYAGHFMVWSRSMIPLLKNILENYIQEDLQLPIAIDRIWQLSNGGSKFPYIRLLVPNKTFAYQNDGISNNKNGKFLKLTSLYTLNKMHELVHKLYKNGKENKKDDSIAEYHWRNQAGMKNPNFNVTVVTAFFPISSKFGAEKYIRYGRHLIENISSPLIVITSHSLKDDLMKLRPLNWPMKLITYENFDDFLEKEKLVDFFAPLDSKIQECADLSKKIIKKNITKNLYKLYLCKPFFMKKAREMSAVKTRYFYYVDFGSFRKERDFKVPSSGKRFFQVKNILHHFPSFSKIDTLFSNHCSSTTKVLFQKKSNYESNKIKEFNKWNVAGAHIIATSEGIDFLVNKVLVDLPKLLFSDKYTWVSNDECFWDILSKNYPDDLCLVSTEKSFCPWFGFFEHFNDAFF